MLCIILYCIILNTGRAILNTDRAILNTGRAILNTDRAILNTDRAILNTDRAILNTDRAIRTTDRARLTTDRARLNPDRSILYTDRAILNTDRAILNTDRARLNTVFENSSACQLMSGDWRGTVWTLLVTFCVVIIRCTETFWSPCTLSHHESRNRLSERLKIPVSSSMRHPNDTSGAMTVVTKAKGQNSDRTWRLESGDCHPSGTGCSCRFPWHVIICVAISLAQTASCCWLLKFALQALVSLFWNWYKPACLMYGCNMATDWVGRRGTSHYVLQLIQFCTCFMVKCVQQYWHLPKPDTVYVI
jgi:hypothetical protein